MLASVGPELSVVIPLYNRAATIQATLASVLARSLSDFEVVVVDDGSTGGGPEIAAAMRSQARRGVRPSLVAISKASYDGGRG